MKKQITISGRVFNYEKHAQDFAKGILYSSEIGTVLNKDEMSFMEDYFSCFHSNWHQKKGCGILAIKRILEPNYRKYRGFLIVRTDGSTTDISYIIQGIKQKPGKDKTEFKKALRQSIVPQMTDYKKRIFAESGGIVRCEITKEPLFFEDAHTDHFPLTFDEIAERFIKEKGLESFENMVVDGVDNHTTYELIDKSLSLEFSNYHYKLAKYRILSQFANLSIARREYFAKIKQG